MDKLKECTCPNWWFPAHKREKLRKLPHGYQGALAHHESCEKRKHQEELMGYNSSFEYYVF